MTSEREAVRWKSGRRGRSSTSGGRVPGLVSVRTGIGGEGGRLIRVPGRSSNKSGEGAPQAPRIGAALKRSRVIPAGSAPAAAAGAGGRLSKKRAFTAEK